MSSFPGAPKLLKGGIVLIDPATSRVQRLIALQYNPDTLSRTLQVQGAGSESGDRLEALRIKGPPVETIKLEAEIDATDQLEMPEQNRTATEVGIHPQLAALEMLLYPPSTQVLANEALALAGTIEIVPVEAPLAVFVWSKSRILPVRVTEFSITEEAFDQALNPIRAKVSLGLRVLSLGDVGMTHRAGSLFTIAHQQKERLAAKSEGGLLAALGLERLP